MRFVTFVTEPGGRTPSARRSRSRHRLPGQTYPAKGAARGSLHGDGQRRSEGHDLCRGPLDGRPCRSTCRGQSLALLSAFLGTVAPPQAGALGHGAWPCRFRTGGHVSGRCRPHRPAASHRMSMWRARRRTLADTCRTCPPPCPARRRGCPTSCPVLPRTRLEWWLWCPSSACFVRSMPGLCQTRRVNETGCPTPRWARRPTLVRPHSFVSAIKVGSLSVGGPEDRNDGGGDLAPVVLVAGDQGARNRGGR